MLLTANTIFAIDSATEEHIPNELHKQKLNSDKSIPFKV
jgi:hypothetical protein